MREIILTIKNSWFGLIGFGRSIDGVAEELEKGKEIIKRGNNGKIEDNDEKYPEGENQLS